MGASYTRAQGPRLQDRTSVGVPFMGASYTLGHTPSGGRCGAPRLLGSGIADGGLRIADGEQRIVDSDLLIADR